MRLATAIVILAFYAQGVAAQDPALLPDPGAPEGAVAVARSERPFDSYQLPVRRYRPGAPGAREIQGRVIWSAFNLTGTEATTAEVMEGYRSRLADEGFQPLFECTTTACGGFDFRFNVQLLPPPTMLMDAADFSQLSAAKGTGPGRTYISVLVTKLLGSVHIQTVLVAPAEGTAAIENAPASGETTDPAVLPKDEAGLLAQLRMQGHVPVRGLNFQTGGAALTEDSQPALAALSQVLIENSDLSVVIVGHSDNVGGLDPNLALSKRRAEAVRDALIARGVEAGRLDARGVGYLAPISTNTTEAGRSLNRRVELVLR